MDTQDRNSSIGIEQGHASATAPAGQPVDEVVQDILIDSMYGAAGERRPTRRRLWVPPELGDRYRRRHDDSEWVVKMVYRRDQQVRLVAVDGASHCFPFADDLDRDFEVAS